MRFGPADGPQVVAALPLFEEANRTRAFVVTILRLLAAQGIGSALPDLPGQGESLVPTEQATVLDMQVAFAAASEATGSLRYTMAVRSGALLDALAIVNGRWHLAPQSGPELLRELSRIKQMRRDGSPLDTWWFDGPAPADTPVEVAGNLVGVDLVTELTVKEPIAISADVPQRVVRLAGDKRPADVYLHGPPLWRRAEPDNDPTFAQILSDDIADWMRG